MSTGTHYFINNNNTYFHQCTSIALAYEYNLIRGYYIFVCKGVDP
jgi:hypothetical protein